MSSLPGVSKADAEELLEWHSARGEGHVVAGIEEYRAHRVLEEDADLWREAEVVVRLLERALSDRDVPLDDVPADVGPDVRLDVPIRGDLREPPRIQQGGPDVERTMLVAGDGGVLDVDGRGRIVEEDVPSEGQTHGEVPPDEGGDVQPDAAPAHRRREAGRVPDGNRELVRDTDQRRGNVGASGGGEEEDGERCKGKELPVHAH